MLYVQPDGTIKLTRGDTAWLTVDIDNASTGEPYELDEDDELVLTVKASTKDDSPILIQKTINGSKVFHIEPDDTKDLKYAKYKYDIQLTTIAGDVYTIIEPSAFEVLAEVTF